MNIKNYKSLFILLFSFIFSSLTSLASEYTLEELNELKRLKAITEEEYEILKMEITEGSVIQDGVYTLKIGRKSLSRNYKVIIENGREYLELQEFFAVIGFSNYYPKKDGVTIYLGETLEEIKLDYSKNKVFRQGEEVFPEQNFQKVVLKGNSIYLEKEIFKELFLYDLRIDSQKLEIAMELGFTHQ